MDPDVKRLWGNVGSRMYRDMRTAWSNPDGTLIVHPMRDADVPEDPRIGGYRMGMIVEPSAYDEQAMAQSAREVAARRVRGELAPSAAVERRFGEFAAPSPPPAPTRADAWRMGGIADMSEYQEAPRDFYKKLDVAGAERDVAPDPNMNLFAASPQQTRVAETHAAVPDALLIPTSPTDLALMSLGPAGKIAGVPGKVAAMTAGLMASGIDPAEAKTLRHKLGDLFARRQPQER